GDVRVERQARQRVALLDLRGAALDELERRLLPHEHVEDLLLDLLAEGFLDVLLLDEAAFDGDLAELPAEQLLLLEQRVEVVLRDALAAEEDLAQLVDPLHRRGEQPHAFRGEVDGLPVLSADEREDAFLVVHRQELEQVAQPEDFDIAFQEGHVTAPRPAAMRRIASGYASHSAWKTRSASVSGVSSGRTGTFFCR